MKATVAGAVVKAFCCQYFSDQSEADATLLQHSPVTAGFYELYIGGEQSVGIYCARHATYMVESRWQAPALCGDAITMELRLVRVAPRKPSFSGWGETPDLSTYAFRENLEP